MVWAKIDDEILDNPKILRVGVYGFALHVAAIAWCSRNLTDGFVPLGVPVRLLDLSHVQIDCRNPLALPWEGSSMAGEAGLSVYVVIDALVSAGLWDVSESGGWQLHDFLVYNPSREEVLRKRENSATRKAKQRSVTRTVTGDVTPHVTAGQSRDSRCGHAASHSHVTPPPVPDPDPLTNQEEIPPTPRRSPAAPGVKSSRGSRAPSSVDPEAVAWCSKNGLPPPTDPEVASFLDYWCAVAGSRGLKIDWTATYRNRPTKTIPRASLKDHRQPASPATAAWRQETLVPAGEVPDDFLSYEVAK